MPEEVTDTVLLVCDDEALSNQILSKLYDHNYRIVGPATTARYALALAAQTEPTLGLIASPPAGQRKAKELAQALMTTWGVRSHILEGALDSEAPRLDAFWAPREGQMARLKLALEA